MPNSKVKVLILRCLLQFVKKWVTQISLQQNNPMAIY